METTIEILKKRIKTCCEVAADENESANAYRANAKKAQAEADKHLAEAAMHERAIEVLKAVEGIQKASDLAGDGAGQIDTKTAPAPYEWVAHNGSLDRPCPMSKEVMIKLRNGTEVQIHANESARWTHAGRGDDIVAYYVLR